MLFATASCLDLILCGNGASMSVGSSMPDPIAERLSSLPFLDKTVLCRLWQEFFDAQPSPKLRRDFMIPILAYRIQERAFGTLRPNTRNQLGQLGRSLDTRPNSRSAFTPQLRAGTRLVRRWKNDIHVVNVEYSGYEYRGTRYQTLSQIARLITGTRWSGPLFFGTKHNQKQRASTQGVE